MNVELAAKALLEALGEHPELKGTWVDACARELDAALKYVDEREQFSRMTWEVHPDYDQPGAPHDMLIGPCKCGAWHGPGEVEYKSIPSGV